MKIYNTKTLKKDALLVYGVAAGNAIVQAY